MCQPPEPVRTLGPPIGSCARVARNCSRPSRPSRPSMSITSNWMPQRSPMLAWGQCRHHWRIRSGSVVASWTPLPPCRLGIRGSLPDNGKTGIPRRAYSSAHSARLSAGSATDGPPPLRNENRIACSSGVSGVLGNGTDVAALLVQRQLVRRRGQGRLLGAGQATAVPDPAQRLLHHGQLRLLRWVVGNSTECSGWVVNLVACPVLLDEASAIPPDPAAGLAGRWSAELCGQVLRRVLLER